jgi:plastocyanin
MLRRTLLSILVPIGFLLAIVAAPVVVQAGGGCHGPATPPGDDEASVVKIDGCMFYPTIARVPVGTTVRFVNSGQVPHNVTGVSGTWASAQLASGAEYRQTFSAEGIYPFACTLHPGMNGAIVVGEATAADGQAPAVVTTGTDAAADTQLTAAVSDTTESGPVIVAGVAGAGLGAFIALAAVALRRHRVGTTAAD